MLFNHNLINYLYSRHYFFPLYTVSAGESCPGDYLLSADKLLELSLDPHFFFFKYTMALYKMVKDKIDFEYVPMFR